MDEQRCYFFQDIRYLVYGVARCQREDDRAARDAMKRHALKRLFEYIKSERWTVFDDHYNEFEQKLEHLLVCLATTRHNCFQKDALHYLDIFCGILPKMAMNDAGDIDEYIMDSAGVIHHI